MTPGLRGRHLNHSTPLKSIDQRPHDELLTILTDMAYSSLVAGRVAITVEVVPVLITSAVMLARIRRAAVTNLA